MTPERFFEAPQGAARLKHEILGKYLRPFVQKTGRWSPGHAVAYIDGYAGRGTYEDESPGSPAIAVAVAELVAGVDHVVGHLVEEDGECYEELSRYVAAHAPSWQTYKGRIEDNLDVILDRTRDLPMFAFLDPFGLVLPMDTIVSRLLGRRAAGGGRVATEVLLNFSLSGLRRRAGHLSSASTHERYARARETILRDNDATLDGDWWREIWLGGESRARETEIFQGYLSRLRDRAPTWHQFVVPVSDEWMGDPAYYLLHLTQHPDGVWLFNESVSGALELYRTFCLQRAGQLDLEPLSTREARWVDEIGTNIGTLLGEVPSFNVQDEMSRIYGAALGFAREKHVRAAIKRLHNAGVTSTSGVGNVQHMHVARAR